MPVTKILPGEFYVTVEEQLIATVLGSCVSACVRDRVFGIGGMNHFMLPQQSEHVPMDKFDSSANRYGNFAMEHMINTMLTHGAKRENLEFKIAGGGRIISGMTNIGQLNIDFILNYIQTENLQLLAKDLDGDLPRKVIYHPRSGKMLVKKLKTLHNNTIFSREEHYREQLQQLPVSGGINLF